MTKQEFFDKIDNVRVMTNHLFRTKDDMQEWCNESNQVTQMLKELREEAPMLLEEEFDAGYELGLDRASESGN